MYHCLPRNTHSCSTSLPNRTTLVNWHPSSLVIICSSLARSSTILKRLLLLVTTVTTTWSSGERPERTRLEKSELALSALIYRDATLYSVYYNMHVETVV